MTTLTTHPTATRTHAAVDLNEYTAHYGSPSCVSEFEDCHECHRLLKSAITATREAKRHV